MSLKSELTGAVALPGLMADMARYGVVFSPDFEVGFESGEAGLGEADTGELSEAELDDGTGSSEPRRRKQPDPEPEGDEDDDAEAGFLKGFEEAPKDGDKPPKEGAKPAGKEGEAAAEEDGAQATDLADDVVIKIGDAKVKASDLKALHARSAEITAQGTATAAANQQALQRAERGRTIVAAAVKQAEDAFKPYAEMDFLVLAKTLDTQTLTDLRKDAKAASDNLQAVKAAEAQLDAAITETRAAVDAEKARACVSALTADFPKELGEEWSEDRYKSLLEFGQKHGLTYVSQSTDAATFKLLRMAQRYAEGRVKAAEAVKPVARQPAKPARAGAASTSSPTRGAGYDNAMRRLRSSGSSDAAEDAFMATFERRE